MISVHLPKTAGTSLKHALTDYFGKERIIYDYGDYPINTPVLKRNFRAAFNCFQNYFRKIEEVKCIHGHFLPIKYLFLGNRNDTKFTVWLRDPVERMASHYYFWKRLYEPLNAPPLHKRVVEEDWSLEKFCFSSELKNFYCQFLWRFPIDRFNFIGITERFEEEFEYFSNKFFQTSLTFSMENRNPENKTENGYIADSDLRKKIERFHEKDMALYYKFANKEIHKRYRE